MFAVFEEYLDQSDKKVTWTEIAKIIGLTTGAFSHWKNDGTEMNFPSFLNLARITIKNNYIDVFSDWCLKFEKPQNIKCALEFLSLNRKLDHLEKLINIIKTKYSSRELKDWAEVYSIILMYQRDSKDLKYIERLRDYSPKFLETKILATIVEIYRLYEEKEYNSMLATVKTIENALEKIKDGYIRESISNRVFQILAFTYLYRYADTEKARYYVNKIISSKYSAILAFDSYYVMGMTFFFEDCDKCLAYLEKYSDFLENTGREELADLIRKNNIPFVQAYWGRKQLLEENVSLSEKAHYEAKWGDKRKALDMIEKAIINEGVSPFKLYYKALATNDTSLFLESLVLFSQKGNKFFAYLPYEHLKNHPTLSNVAKLLYEN
jgi:hypothetical protein